MPEKTQTIPVQGYDSPGILSMAYGSFLQLGWTIKYAGVKMLIGYTPRSWKKYEEEITISTEENQLTITSKMIHGEALDMMGKNKKHIAEFLAAFEKVKTSLTDQQLSDWNQKIALLKEDTNKVAEQEIKQAEEVDKVMNLSKGNLNVTYVIIGINVLVFIAMVISGVSFMTPSPEDIWNWGGNLAVSTSQGQAWRLITNVFVHIGFLHLLFNMYGLYFIGAQLEPMLGKTRYISAYLSAGILASITSLWWHRDENIVGAGASGAIFGLFGVFLALLTTHLIPKQVRTKMMQSTAIFVGYNLFYGLKGGVDNSAHIGGLLSGMAIGYLFYFFKLRNKETETANQRIIISVFIIAATVVISYLVLQSVAQLFQ